VGYGAGCASAFLKSIVAFEINGFARDTDLYLSPGFVDLQVNGCAGFDMNAEQISTDTVIGLVDAMLANGVTRFAPTLITAPEDGICRGLKVIAKTHLGNGIAQEIPRHRNPIWSQLADDRLTATFIADGHHVPADVLKVMLRAKGVGRSVLVSDSVALTGMPPGTYTTPVGGRVELRPDGRLCILGSTLLAGSTASLAQCVGHLMRMTELPLKNAIAMVTANPGRFASGSGQFAAGSRADLVRFRWSDEVFIEDVWLAGERVHGRGGESGS